MSIVSLEEMQQDHLVMSVARALAVANEAALAHGTAPAESLVTITEEAPHAQAAFGASIVGHETTSVDLEAI
jgi:hypothetical protein